MSYKHESGTTNPKTVTVPAGYRVLRWSCVGATGGGTIAITPYGGTEQSAIPVGEGETIGDECDARELTPGSTLVFAGCARWLVRYRDL